VMEYRSFVVSGRGSHETNVLIEAQALADTGVQVRIVTPIGTYILRPSPSAVDEACGSVEFATAMAYRRHA
jgi:hypothetical protein